MFDDTDLLGIGVFYFPPNYVEPDARLAAAERTMERLRIIRDEFTEKAIKGKEAPQIHDLLIWLTRYANLLEHEAEKLRQKIWSDSSNEDGPATTLNGHPQ